MSEDIEKPDQLGEPSVLDYVKSLFRFGNGERIQIPFEDETVSEAMIRKKQSLFDATPRLQPVDDVQVVPSFVEAPASDLQPLPEPLEESSFTPFPWRSLLAFLFAWIAQQTFEPPHAATEFGLAIYVAAFSLLGWAIYRGEWKLPIHAATAEKTDP